MFKMHYFSYCTTFKNCPFAFAFGYPKLGDLVKL